jgi:hypothetical protein
MIVNPILKGAYGDKGVSCNSNKKYELSRDLKTFFDNSIVLFSLVAQRAYNWTTHQADAQCPKS